MPGMVGEFSIQSFSLVRIIAESKSQWQITWFFDAEKPLFTRFAKLPLFSSVSFASEGSQALGGKANQIGDQNWLTGWGMQALTRLVKHDDITLMQAPTFLFGFLMIQFVMISYKGLFNYGFPNLMLDVPSLWMILKIYISPAKVYPISLTVMNFASFWKFERFTPQLVILETLENNMIMEIFAFKVVLGTKIWKGLNFCKQLMSTCGWFQSLSIIFPSTSLKPDSVSDGQKIIAIPA